ncbi:GreA/GreB family elongation factor [Kitasatospora sp. RB6PN24]|uniref:GreA/GreB family elongation factor n=1 Tax=Kitasatospora humi TaxID=2893891 RepID=UPI001E392200|nr:GreA/GreB family elongation factor [Kitasatospora humi]MCC9307391.1 GreA/GreB family elongation factor [Kitasatospora humi]
MTTGSTGPAPVSPEGRRALEAELAEVRAERAAVAATLRDKDGVGDRADDADELQRVSDVARLDRRIREIEARLTEGVVAGSPRTDTVGVGSTVTLRFADGATETFEISEVANELDESLVTDDSPLGLALLGRRAGETVEYETPGGRMSATVVSIGQGREQA